MHCKTWILGVILWSLAAGCRSHSGDKPDLKPPDPSQAEVTELRKCVLSHLPAKDAAQTERVVSGFDLVQSFAQCRTPSNEGGDLRSFQLTMDGFSEPVGDNPSQFRIVSSTGP